MYVLYNKQTKREVKRFKTMRGAKISLAAKLRKFDDSFAILEASIFEDQYNKWTTVKSLVGGHEVRIREQDVGTCVDPSTETYWSM